MVAEHPRADPDRRTRTSRPSRPTSTAAYARLEAMRDAAERVRPAYSDVRAGGTHQARLERDIAWDVTQRRLADLDIGDAPLVFGRLDMAPIPGGDLDSPDGEAVAGTSGASRSRTSTTPRSSSTGARRSPSRSTGRRRWRRWTSSAAATSSRRRAARSTGLDDEVFDQRAIEEAGLEVAGEGALLAALERDRTGRMGDIVATIQAEQDQAIRADLPGVLVVARRPGHRQDRGRAAPGRLPALHAPAAAGCDRACCSSVRARCSSGTSNRCCRRSASRTCSSRRSPA